MCWSEWKDVKLHHRMSILRLHARVKNIGSGASLSKEATLSGRLYERIDDGAA